MFSRTAAARLRLLAGTAALALLSATAGPTLAQDKPQTAPCQTCVPDTRPASVDTDANEAAARADVLGEDGFYLESDELIDDGENQRVIARGSVEARYQGRTLRAREVEYRTETGVVIARGDAQIINADGTAQFADEIELDEELTAGVATGFSSQLGQGVKIAAASAVRRSETVTDLNRAIYTPCAICADNGRPKSPTYSLQAERVTQDRSRRIVYYRNAVLRVKNVPVAYLPVFWHPDPTAQRASGFLVPDIELSRRRGVSYEQPYYWAISPSQDLVISPQFNERVNPFLNLDYRKRFHSGQVRARLGYTHEQDFGDLFGVDPADGQFKRLARDVKFGDDTSRSYVLADGQFDLTENWRWGFSAERTSDDLLFRKYDIGRVYQDRGLYLADSQRLISQLYTVRSGPRSYLSVGAMSFQGLRPLDDDGTFPTVAPLVEGRFEPDSPIAGGRLRVRGSGVVLLRDESPLNPNIAGTDSRRATIEADWRRPFTFSNGLRVEPLALVRGDAYSLSDAPGFDDRVTRGTATIGAEAKWPFIRRTRTGSIMLEPIVQVLISPDADRSADVPNEDSTVLTFDETNLFSENRYPGFDRYEGGQRVNLGGRATFDWGGGREATLFAGRSFRTDRDLTLAPTSGLREKASDYLLAATARPFDQLFVYTRARLDSETGEVRRAEAAANVNFSRVRGAVRYWYDDANPRGVRAHDLDLFGEVMLTRNWGIIAFGSRDIEQDVFRRGELGLLYQDDCVRLEIVYEREETFNRTLGPSEGVTVRLSLATLGVTTLQDYDSR
jgi:LPS-assembly protein